jgi:hypothetical protein
MEASNLDMVSAVSDAERAGLVWQKASASTSYGQCVELAVAAGGVAMRDSKDPDGPILLYTRAEFKAFLDGARNGDFSGVGQ